MSGRHLVAAVPTQREPEHSALTEIPALYEQLRRAVVDRLTVEDRAGFGTALPIRAAVHDMLYCSDHVGHMGLVPGVVAMETVTRLALGDSLPRRHPEPHAVIRACRYLAVQNERVIAENTWTDAATGELATIVDNVLSRVDVERVRLDWELMRKRARGRITEIDGTVPDDDQHNRDLDVERAACEEALEMCYVDYEGRLYDAITDRYMATAGDPFGWYGFVVAETAWMVTAGRALLGLSEHSQRRIVECPMQCGGWVGLSADPDIANCDGCGKTWPIADGQAGAFFGAFRDAGWVPRRVA